MIEVEMKFPLDDFAHLENALAGWSSETIEETDHYFNAPDRDFARTDEALRLRCVGSTSCVTYKGPKLDSVTKSRLEVEVVLADGADNAQNFVLLLRHLGYRSTAVVRKRRRMLRGQRDGFPVAVCLDDVEHVGRFAEIEVQAEDNDVDRARNLILHLARELRLGLSERRSYLELFLEQSSQLPR